MCDRLRADRVVRPYKLRSGVINTWRRRGFYARGHNRCRSGGCRRGRAGRGNCGSDCRAHFRVVFNLDAARGELRQVVIRAEVVAAAVEGDALHDRIAEQDEFFHDPFPLAQEAVFVCIQCKAGT